MRTHAGGGQLADMQALSDDAWQLILQQLSLRDLACMLAVSKSVRAVVHRQPEAVWKAAAARDPGERGLLQCTGPVARQSRADPDVYAAYPAEDPVHAAPHVQAALQLRHSVQSNARAGRVRVDRLPGGGAACLASGHIATVQGEHGSLQLVLRDLWAEAGASLYTWELPPRVRRAGQLGTWRWGCQALALPCSGEGFN